MALVLAAALLACAQPAAPPHGVILLVVDTLRADHLGLYGYARPTSPHLDRWARHGVVFERAFSAAPWTLPAMGSLLTGELPAVHGAVGRYESRAFFPPDPGLPTLAGRMRDEAGRATAAFGSNVFLLPQMAAGFDTWDVDASGERRAAEIVDRSLEWLGAHQDEPFFLMIHFMDPHQPYDAPDPFGGRFTRDLISQVPRPPGDPQRVRREIAALGAADRALFVGAYDEEIAYWDSQLERLRGELERRGLLRRSAILLTSDHGEELFDHGSYEHGHSVYQELLHVPLVLWGPRVQPRRVPEPVSLIDVMPTLLDAADVSTPASAPGRSLWPAALGAAPPAARSLFAQDCLYGDDQVAAIRWPIKLIGSSRSGAWTFFDLERDPQELRGRPDRGSAALRELRRDLRDQLARSRADAERAPVELGPDEEERLRELGYLE